MVEAGLTEGVTSGCNKENDRTKPLFAFGGTKELNELNGFVGHGFRLARASLRAK